MKRRLVSILAALALCLGLLPGTALAEEIGEEDSVQPRAVPADIDMSLVTDYSMVLARGVPIVIKENGTITSIYDTDGNLLSGETDVSNCTIYGGWYDYGNDHSSSTSIVMESGTVLAIYGGSYSDTLDGDTNIVLNGGTVGWVYGGGCYSNVTGTAHVTVNSGAKIWGQKMYNSTAERGTVFGGSNGGTVGNTEVVFNGGDAGWIYGGGTCTYDQDGSPIAACTCTNTHVKFMGQPDDFMIVSGGSNGGSVGKAVLEFHGTGYSPTNQGILVYGGGWADSVDEVQIIVGKNSDPSSTEFRAQWTGSGSTVGTASFDVSWDPEQPSMMNSSKLNGAGVTGEVSAYLHSDRSRDSFVHTGLEEIDELILEGIHFSADPNNGIDLDRLEINASASLAVLAKQGITLAVKELAGSGYIYFEKPGSSDGAITPITVDEISVPSGARIKVGRLGGLPDQVWEDAALFTGPGVQALTSLDCFVSVVEGYELVRENDTVKVQAGTGPSQAYLDPVPRFDRENKTYQYGETIQVTMGLKCGGQPLADQVLSVEGGSSGHQSFATGVTDANGMVTISVPVNDAVWNSAGYALGGYFAGTEDYKGNWYAVSSSDGNFNYTIEPAQVALSGEITAPARGGVPVRTLSTGESAVCTAEVIWSPADAAFRPEVAYTASIRLVPKPGYSLDGGRLGSVTYQGQPLTLPGSTEADGSMVISNVRTFAPISAIHVTGITLDPAALSLGVGETARLTAEIAPADADNKGVTWTSSDPAVAVVDEDGRVTAVSTGSAVITVTTADGGRTDTCTVEVTAPAISVTGVTLNKTSLSLPVSGSEQLTAVVSPDSATNKDVTWASSDPAVAVVDENGNVTAVSAGSAVITVTTADGGWTDTCTVTAREAAILPDPPAGDGDTAFRLVMEPGISEVPAGLLDIDTLNTTKKLETTMRAEITQAVPNIPQANTAVYNVTLLVSTDGGETWMLATKDNFPAGGLTVTLPYPSGTNSSYRFTVVHMFTTSDFHRQPGETEVFTPDKVKNTAKGIQVVVTGLSPISVGWTAPATDPVTPPSGGHEGGSRNPSTSTYSVAIEKPQHGEVTSNRANASNGSTVTLTVTPENGYVLDTLTVTDSRGNVIRTIAQGGGKYTFTMPGSAVTVTAAFIPLPDGVQTPCDGGADCPSRSYTDLGSAGMWYHEAVDYVLRNHLMDGYGNGVFGPDDTLSRAQFAQILYNREGKPVTAGGSAFADVLPSAWYTPAITWTVERGIVGGYGNGMFGPDDNITREQLAVMLWRYAGSPAAAGKELHFDDAGKIGGYALEALRWATESGIVNGDGSGRLDPQGLATRAQAAQMLKTFLEK